MSEVTKKILLVDDEAIIALSEAKKLQKRGYEVHTAGSGDEAIEYVRSDSVDLVLMDIDLGFGEMDGTEAALKILRETDLPIVFLSSHTETEVVEKTERITSYGYVVKNSGDTILDASIKMAFKLFEAHQREKQHQGESEDAVRQIRLREERLEHINRVLVSMRNINRIITKDPSIVELIDETCRFLVDQSGYFNAWVVLLEKDKPKEPFFHHGFKKNCFNEMAKNLKSGWMPPCAEKALSSGEIIITEKPEETCYGCPLKDTYTSDVATASWKAKNAGMTSRIEHAGKVYGWLNVSIPERYAADEDEHELFKEIVNDIGYALHKIEIGNERIEAFSELNRKKHERESILDSLVEHVIYEDKDLKIIWPNKAACDSAEGEREELIGRYCYQIWPQRDSPCEDCPVLEAIEKGEPCEIEKSTPDGKSWFIRGYPVKDDKGQVQGAVEVTLDITGNKKSEEKLRQLTERMTLAANSAGIGVWDLDLETNDLFWDEWMFRLYGIENRDFQEAYKSWRGRVHPEDLDRTEREINEAIEGIREFNTQFRIVTPEQEVRNLRAFAKVIRDEEKKPLRMIGVNYDMTEHIRGEKELFRSQENLKATLRSIGDAVIATDTEGLIEQMNPVAEKLTGWSLQEAKGRALPEVFRIINAQTDEPAENPVWKVLKSGQIVGLANHTLLIAKDGTRYQIADSGAPIRDADNRITGVVLVFRDVTEEYRIKEKLKENEDRLSKIMLAANDGIWDWDLRTDEVYFDRRYYEMAGYDQDDFPHRLEEFQNRIHPDEVGYVLRTAERHLKGEIDRFIVEFRFAKKDGGWIWILGRGIIVERDSDGTALRFVGTHTDISDRKAIEETLRTERRRLSDVLEGTNVGSWEWNVQTGETIFNERWAQIVGYALEEISPTTVETWMNLVHPEDLKLSNELLEKHFRGETDFYECEVRMKHREGHWVWVLDRGRIASRTEDGKPLLVSGTHQDITERKHAENSLQESLSEKDTLLLELQHRVKNSFNLIISMLNLTSGKVKSRETEEILRMISSRIRALSELYSLLYQSESIHDVQLRDYCTKVISTMKDLSGTVRVHADIENIVVSVREAASVGLIITELVTNALNHALDELMEGWIEVRLRREGSSLRLEVENNGKPLPEDFALNNSKGIGLQLVQALTSQHRGSFQCSGGMTTTMAVELKIQ